MATAEKTSKPKRVVMPADQARQHLGDVMNRACFQGERFVLTSHRKAKVAVVGIEDLEKLERLEKIEAA